MKRIQIKHKILELEQELELLKDAYKRDPMYIKHQNLMKARKAAVIAKSKRDSQYIKSEIKALQKQLTGEVIPEKVTNHFHTHRQGYRNSHRWTIVWVSEKHPDFYIIKKPGHTIWYDADNPQLYCPVRFSLINAGSIAKEPFGIIDWEGQRFSNLLIAQAESTISTFLKNKDAYMCSLCGNYHDITSHYKELKENVYSLAK
jgi:hypothetical protein